jgi:hypothetical protein
MKRLLLAMAMMLSFAISGYTQQDPDDPGMQDSLIIGDAYVDSGANFAFIQEYFVTDDSVIAFEIPLTLRSEYDGVCFGTGTQYFPPLNSWPLCFDTVSCNPPFWDRICWCDLGGNPLPPPIYTDSTRIVISVNRLIILPNSPQQIVTIDTFSTCWFATSDREFVPAFIPGYLHIGIPDGIDYDIPEPSTFSLSQNYPNPFNSSTEIEFSLPQSGPVSLVIYDIQGREIRRLIDGNLEAGGHSVIWNGLNDESAPVSSGIYFYKLVSNNSSQTNRMTLLR